MHVTASTLTSSSPVAPDGAAAGGTAGLDPSSPRERGRVWRPSPGKPMRRRPGLRARLTTPLLLQVALVSTAVAVVVFGLTINDGVSRNAGAVRTVGTDATSGITAAQRIKVNLAELDELVAENLLDRTALDASGFPAVYDAKRGELHANLVLAASAAPAGQAHQQPLADVDYVLAHYHALVKDSFAASTRGDGATAAAVYAQAHSVMADALFPRADAFDKANTYVLNATYDAHKADAAQSVSAIMLAFVALLVVLAAVQLLLAMRFHRLLNAAMMVATVLALVNGFFAISRLEASSSDLEVAREQAFDSVHRLARARAIVVTGRQSEAQLLLDPSSAPSSEAAFDADFAKLFHLPGGLPPTSQEQASDVPEGAGGHLAAVLAADVSEEANHATREALRKLIALYLADGELRVQVADGRLEAARAAFKETEGYDEAARDLANAQAVDQRIFDAFAGSAETATAHVERLNLGIAVAMLVLVIGGLGQRLAEYRQ
jgi:hypothetical protein